MYSLTDKDRKIIQGTINKVNNLTGNMSPNPKRRSKPAFRYAEITGVLEDGFYSAKEIRFLADGTHEDAPNGIIWDGEKVKLLITGSVSAGTVTRVEPFYMVEEDKIVNIWAGSAVGGGGETLWCFLRTLVEDNKYIGDVVNAPIQGLANVVVLGGADIIVNNIQYGEIEDFSTPLLGAFYPATVDDGNGGTEVKDIFYATAPTWGS